MKGIVILVKVDEMYNILKSHRLPQQSYKRFVETSLNK